MTNCKNLFSPSENELLQNVGNIPVNSKLHEPCLNNVTFGKRETRSRSQRTIQNQLEHKHTAANKHTERFSIHSSSQSDRPRSFLKKTRGTKRLFTKKTYHVLRQREWEKKGGGRSLSVLNGEFQFTYVRRKIDCSRAGNRQRLSRVERRLDYRRSAGPFGGAANSWRMDEQRRRYGVWGDGGRGPKG